MNEKKVLFVGLHGAGKTTFLAALWQLVDSQIEGKSFSLRSLEGDQEYLNSIREAWLSYTTVPRTFLKEGMNKKAEMKLINLKTQEDVTLVVPDLSGEIFEELIQLRQLREDLKVLIQNTNGIVLFINPSKITKPNLIVHAQELQNLLMEGLEHEEEIEDQSSTELKEWSHEMVPSQVKLTDLLQLILGQKSKNEVTKLSIIISAWDLVENQDNFKIEPSQWVKVNLPMFYQYLYCNSSVIETAFYGVSAQGADYESKKVEKLYEIIDPTERIIVKIDSEYCHDISLPILWVANQT
ncbi:hypothetical protein GCM10028805_46000 [Spirosoma harenae]